MASGHGVTCVAGSVQPRQLAFALPHAESLTRDNFPRGPANAAALTLVESWPDWPNRHHAAGRARRARAKSHLAAIWAEQSGARVDSRTALTPPRCRVRSRPARWSSKTSSPQASTSARCST
jgi:hypothetical protein